MGNQNLSFYDDIEFMYKYLPQQELFKAQKPLFDVKNIKFPLSTKSMKIVDATGKRVKLAGGNWSGPHMKRHCVSGLQFQKLQDLCHYIKEQFYFNVIRLTFSLEMYYSKEPIPSQYTKANPEFEGKIPMQVFDSVVNALTEQGIMVILNNHTSKSQWCCSTGDGDGLWWTQEYSQKKFEDCLIGLAHRYKCNQRVIGIDLRNQIRKAKGLKPTWGGGNPLTDWHQEAQVVGNRILGVAPQWLIIIGGIDYQLDFTQVINYPIKLSIPNKLVYSGHFYGFSWGPSIIWMFKSYEKFHKEIFNEQLFVRYCRNVGTPFLLGQFGTNTRDTPWLFLMRLIEEYDLDWTYWCIDGYKCDKMEEQTYGLWNFQSNANRQPEILNDLKRIGRP